MAYEDYEDERGLYDFEDDQIREVARELYPSLGVGPSAIIDKDEWYDGRYGEDVAHVEAHIPGYSLHVWLPVTLDQLQSAIPDPDSPRPKVDATAGCLCQTCNELRA